MSTLLMTGDVVEKQPTDPPALFQLAFRPFFLFGSLFSIISLARKFHETENRPTKIFCLQC